ncbi:Protein kinase domain-containing protein [Lachancea thermotolerans]
MAHTYDLNYVTNQRRQLDGGTPVFQSQNDSSETFKKSFEGTDDNKNSLGAESSQAGSEESEGIYFKPDLMHKENQQPRPRGALIRVYSENERSNFNESTGARLYDDLRYRPMHYDGSGSPPKSSAVDIVPKSKRRHSSSWDEDRMAASSRRCPIDVIGDMQDEYIPDLDFSTAFSRWQSDDNLHDQLLGEVQPQGLSRMHCYNDWAGYETDLSRSSSASSSSIVFRSAHAKVAPIPLPRAGLPSASPNRAAHNQMSSVFGGLSHASQLSYPRNRPVPMLNTAPGGSYRNLKRRKSGLEAESPSSPVVVTPGTTLSYASSNDVRFTNDEWKNVIAQLPDNFLSLPYSQRKRILQDKFPDINYKSMMTMLKRYYLNSGKSSSQLQDNKSRRGSLASQFLSSFTPSSTLKSNDKGNVVMGYTLGKIIGFGAWGMIRECYKNAAEDEDGDNVAVKAFKIVKFRNNTLVKEQVLKEVQMWSKLKHPNILPLIDWKLDEDYAMYCLTEKISGGTLYDLVNSWGEASQSKIALSQRRKLTAELGTQIVEALKFMHAKRIIHGDVKLENCLLEEREPGKECRWHVVLCDFGMSSEFEDSAESNRRDGGGNKTLREHAHKGQLAPLRDRPLVFRSASNLTLKSGKFHRSLKGDNMPHGNHPLGVSSFPRHYGPSLTSANISGRFPAKEKSPASESNLQALTFTATSTNGSATTDKDGVPPKLSNATNARDPHSHIGSLPYAAPELLEPTPPPLAPSADIWALGVTLYTMLLGKLLFKHDYEPRLRAMIAAAKYDTKSLDEICVAEANPPCPELLKAVKGCLIKDVAQRWELDAIEIALTQCVKTSTQLEEATVHK